MANTVPVYGLTRSELASFSETTYLGYAPDAPENILLSHLYQSGANNSSAIFSVQNGGINNTDALGWTSLSQALYPDGGPIAFQMTGWTNCRLVGLEIGVAFSDYSTYTDPTMISAALSGSGISSSIVTGALPVLITANTGNYAVGNFGGLPANTLGINVLSSSGLITQVQFGFSSTSATSDSYQFSGLIFKG